MATRLVGEARAKAARARRWLTGRDLALSVQVLQEPGVQATRAGRPGALTHPQAVSFAAAVRRLPVQDIALGLMRLAVGTCQRFGLSYWDSGIPGAARELGRAPSSMTAA